MLAPAARLRRGQYDQYTGAPGTREREMFLCFEKLTEVFRSANYAPRAWNCERVHTWCIDAAVTGPP